MMKFIYTFDDDSSQEASRVEVTLRSNADLTEVLEAFKGFLQAASFQFELGDYLDIVNDNGNQKEPDGL